MHKIRRAVMGAALLASFALGGAGLAGAVSTGNTGSGKGTSAAGARTTKTALGNRSPETPLTGDVLANVKAAALAKVGSGTVESATTETDGGTAAYEAHVTKADGTRVTVYLDTNYGVLSVETGRSGGGRGGKGGHGAETALTGDALARVTAAAIAKVGGTVDRAETDADGNALYEAHVTKADGSKVTVYVDKDFNVVSTEAGRGHVSAGARAG